MRLSNLSCPAVSHTLITISPQLVSTCSNARLLFIYCACPHQRMSWFPSLNSASRNFGSVYARLLRARSQAFGIANSHSLMSSERDCTFLAAYDAPTVDAKATRIEFVVSESSNQARLSCIRYTQNQSMHSVLDHSLQGFLPGEPGPFRFTRDSLGLLFSSRDKPVSLLLLLRLRAVYPCSLCRAGQSCSLASSSYATSCQAQQCLGTSHCSCIHTKSFASVSDSLCTLRPSVDGIPLLLTSKCRMHVWKKIKAMRQGDRIVADAGLRDFIRRTHC